jgi:hypothetical protein
MNVPSLQAQKADPALREALENAEGHETLRTVMVLGGETIASDDSSSPQPDAFEDRTQYRQALISHQKNRLSQEIGAVKTQLRQRALNLSGGTITRAVVVEGKASDLLDALELPGVRHASLDQPLIFDE